MKKRVYTNVTINDATKIWRENTAPTINLSKTNDELIRDGLEYHSIFEARYNDPLKYLRGTKSDNSFNFDTKLLEDFPEYLDDWTTIITNTGLTCFNKGTTLVIYDMFEGSADVFSDIRPDLSMLLDYEIKSQPLNIRKVNFSNKFFIPERNYIKTNYTSSTVTKDISFFINCDDVVISKKSSSYSFSISSAKLNPNFFYELNCSASANSSQRATAIAAMDININKVIYTYKPTLLIKLFNQDATPITTNVLIVKDKDGNSVTVNKYSEQDIHKGFYVVDLTARPIGPITIELSNTTSGYMEVLWV